MSRFRTTIMVPVDETLERLPGGAWVDAVAGIRLRGDRRALVIEWSHEDWVTPFTRPIDLTLDMLEGREPLPECVQAPRECRKVQNAAVARGRRGVAKVGQ